jgi:23S rRNA pseudouridine2605 synthase
MPDSSVPGGTEQTSAWTSGERLQKVLAQRGWGSRRVCEDLISEGRVQVNGEVAVLGRRVDVEQDLISIDGAPVGVRPDFVYYLLNKPTDVISTVRDTHNRTTVTDMVPIEPRVYPVGRLDADSEGLLILTNDGELTNRITHPSQGIEKEYLVHVEASTAGVGESAIHRLRNGVDLDGEITAPAEVSQVQSGVLRIVIHEGKNRQIRRMCEEVGHQVIRLVRVRIGPLVDRSLAPGEWRHLTASEVKSLIEAISN